ncbi:MAG: 16S rRNA (cytosine(1402)-N(4))-methyltransferase RsmH [Acutalibacteraceae bacterium]|jgi:16S rRNA (cytosine1402-N4)-methyltransferase
MEFSHKPVLFRETIEGLAIRPDGIYLDGTAGGGGHSRAIAERLKTGRLIAVDQDPDAIAVLQERLGGFSCVTVVQNNFSNMTEIAAQQQIDHLDGVLLDIGVSSRQLDTPERGFSFHADAPLDMRMSQSGTTAADLVNTLPWQSLVEIFSRYGEEKFSRSIAQAIVSARQTTPILTTDQLTEVIRSAIPAKVRREGGHPSRKVFQALRIAVNGELDALSRGLDSAFELLSPGGRLAVITFHSLEDRIVKQHMAKWCEGCTCPPDFPVCVCGKKPEASLVNRKPIEASPQELEENPRSRSAKLRVCEKLSQDVS